MPYAPAVLTLLAAVLGVFGKTWEPDRVGIKRLTLKGWLVVALGLTSAALSVNTIATERAEKASFRTVAHEDIAFATDRLLSPFRSLYVKYKGPGFLTASIPQPERQALAALRDKISANSLMSDDFLEYLSVLRADELSGEIRGGTRLPYLDHVAVRTAEGRGSLEKALSLGGELLAVNVRTAISSVLQAPYAQSAEARPAALRSLPDAARTILPSRGGAGDALINDYKSYIGLVEALRAAASAQSPN
jgi:hypothetical protein